MSDVAYAVDLLVDRCHKASVSAGWWRGPGPDETVSGPRGPAVDYIAHVRQRTRFGVSLVCEKLDLCHSELSEALEGWRKNALDAHLPTRKSVAVELADLVIRACDLAGALEVPLGSVLAEKMAYNAHRLDHKPEARAATGGKVI